MLNYAWFQIIFLFFFFAIVVAWWLALLPAQGMVFGPQGQGDVRRWLQPGGPALDKQQCDHPQPPQWVNMNGNGGSCARIWFEHRTWWRTRHVCGRRKEAWVVLDWRHHTQYGHYSHSLSNSSKEHELRPGHTPTAGLCIVLDMEALQVISISFAIYWFFYIILLCNVTLGEIL